MISQLYPNGHSRGAYTIVGRVGRLYKVLSDKGDTIDMYHSAFAKLRPKSSKNKSEFSRSKYKSEYQCWANIKKRCFNTKHPQYPYYGGRGIGMYDGWIKDFPAFLKYVGRKPSPELSLDRINNDLGYFPGNVKWASVREQNINRRSPVRKARQPHDWVYEYCWELLAT